MQKTLILNPTSLANLLIVLCSTGLWTASLKGGKNRKAENHNEIHENKHKARKKQKMACFH